MGVRLTSSGRGALATKTPQSTGRRAMPIWDRNPPTVNSAVPAGAGRPRSWGRWGGAVFPGQASTLEADHPLRLDEPPQTLPSGVNLDASPSFPGSAVKGPDQTGRPPASGGWHHSVTRTPVQPSHPAKLPAPPAGCRAPAWVCLERPSRALAAIGPPRLSQLAHGHGSPLRNWSTDGPGISFRPLSHPGYTQSRPLGW